MSDPGAGLVPGGSLPRGGGGGGQLVMYPSPDQTPPPCEQNDKQV